MLTLIILAASGIPTISAVLFIVGAGVWLLSVLLAAGSRPLRFDGAGIGLGLMVLGVGLQVIFGV